MLLMLCVNNYRNGVFSGRCSSISLYDCEQLTLESPYLDRHLKCEIGKDFLRLGKSKQWPHHGEKHWVGNWCWNSVTVAPEVAAGILNFAIRRGYRPTVGVEELWERIDAAQLLTAKDLIEEG